MYRLTFAWQGPKNRFRRTDKWDWLWIVGLLLAAVLMFGIDLGVLPLRDWDEGTVAEVAREIWHCPAGRECWLYPTLGGEPYLNKPPLMHWLIALAYSVGGVHEWSSRLPGAMLTAISVPLLYGIGREIFPQRLPAIFASVVYLTMIPVVRHGRLAMLDGAVVCFFLLMLWSLLRSRRNLHYSLGVGIGFGLICLTKGILGVLLGTVALLFLLWDTPRLLTSWYLWMGVLLGSVPAVSWYTAQWLHYGHLFADQAIVNQSLSRVWTSFEGHRGPPWYYVLEILKYTWPWLIFLPQGLGKTWKNRNSSWAKLVLVWNGCYLLAVSLMGTKLPWYVLPIYPAIALAIGVYLAEIWDSRPASYPRAIVAFLAILAVLSWIGSLYFGLWSPALDWEVLLILVAVAETMTLAAILAARSNRLFLLILVWGMYISLLLLMTSQHWVWELAEAYPVKPVAAMIQSRTSTGQKVYTSFPYGRPSLDFYSGRATVPATTVQLQQYWQQDPQPYFLLDDSTLKNLLLESVRQLGRAEGWTLITKNLPAPQVSPDRSIPEAASAQSLSFPT